MQSVHENSLYTLSVRVEVTNGLASETSVTQSNLDSGIFDEIHVYLAPKLFGKGIPIYQGEGSNDNVFKLKLHNVQTISNDIKIVYKRVH